MYFLNIERKDLYSKTDSRVDQMIQNGFLHEAKNLFSHRQLNPLKTVGYTEMFDFFDGNCSLEEAIEKMKQKTRNYAKRQITWFKNQWNLQEMNATEILNLIQ
jgi:tRNA dimethylallyltransferase